ncbi:DUF7373 family lipoprotein [Antrihabitans stalactiti]|uniref:Uncharacterized protein n=1 Tax=Antrihabitans stalactiti TaxID=2584121 RepID=A0A848KCM3_9NOCA|nr:hypothetical protein [Antrihabitans stalactiti]NMN96041.1 hypothetical protein [Antrihabitans stalactiti]
MNVRSSARIRAVVLIVVAALTGACGSSLSGAPKAGEIDIRQLNIGSYSVEPVTLPSPSQEWGRYREADRMADAVATVIDVDPTLEFQEAGVVDDPESAANVLSFIPGVPVIKPVLEKYGMIIGFYANGLNQEFVRGMNLDGAQFLMIMVNRFPSEDAARQAAVEIDATDFNVSKDNVAVPIGKHPDAKAHWRPGNASIAATLARRQFVVSLQAVYPTPNLDALAKQVSDALDAEVPLIDAFAPTPTDKIATLPLDPDHLVVRALNISSDHAMKPGDVQQFGPRGALHFTWNGHYKDRLLQQYGVDRLVLGTASSIYRVRDDRAATEIFPTWIKAFADSNKAEEIEAKTGVPNARCFERKDAAVAEVPQLRFTCFFTYRDFVARVFSGDKGDAQERAAAQYALLANTN